MKKLYLLILLVCVCLSAWAVPPQQDDPDIIIPGNNKIDISQSLALNNARSRMCPSPDPFVSADTLADYYMTKLPRTELTNFAVYCNIDTINMLSAQWYTENDSVWVVYGDLEPWKGWSHTCKYAVIPTKRSVNHSISCGLFEGFKPPFAYDFEKVHVALYHQNGVLHNHPIVSENSIQRAPSYDILTPTSKLHALLIVGGASKYDNYERYWDYCSYMYQTLIRTYGYQKDNITVLLCDGEGRRIINVEDGLQFEYYSTDLDGDSIDDVAGSMSKQNIQNVMDSLAYELNEDDNLFVFLKVNGGGIGPTESCFWGWGGQEITPTEFYNMLEDINCNVKNIFLSFDMAENYSDLFLYDDGVVLTVNCYGEHHYYGTYHPDSGTGVIDNSLLEDRTDAFLLQWLHIVNKENVEGNQIVGDTNHNGSISMREAFNYANAVLADGTTEPHRDLVSRINYLKEEVELGYVPIANDLYLRSYELDEGLRNDSTVNYMQHYWKCPDIWFSTSQDLYEQNQHNDNVLITLPMIINNDSTLYVMTRVFNRGWKSNCPPNLYLHHYWAFSDLGALPQDWNISFSDSITGVNAQQIAYVNPPSGNYLGGSTLRSTIPIGKGLRKLAAGNHLRLNVAALISDKDSVNVNTLLLEGIPYVNTFNSNKIAMRNIYIIDLCSESATDTLHISVKNGTGAQRSLRIEIQEDGIGETGSVFENTPTKIRLSPSNYSSWINGGGESIHVIEDPYIQGEFGLIDSQSRLTHFSLGANDTIPLQISVGRVANATYPEGPYYRTFDVILRDENTNEIIGGETFIVWLQEGEETVILEPGDPGDPGDIPSPDDPFEQEVIDISLNSNPFGDSVTVNLNATASDSGYIVITSIAYPASQAMEYFSINDTSVIVNTSSLPSGPCSVTCYLNNTVVSSVMGFKQ